MTVTCAWYDDEDTVCGAPAVIKYHEALCEQHRAEHLTLQKTLFNVITPEEVRRVRCPRCGARPGKPCWGARGTARRSNHIERVKLAQHLHPNG